MKCPALLVILYRLMVRWIRGFYTFMNISARVVLLWCDFANRCMWGLFIHHTWLWHRQDSGMYQTSICCRGVKDRDSEGELQKDELRFRRGGGGHPWPVGRPEAAQIDTHHPLLVQYWPGINGAAFKTGCRSSQARRKLREDWPTPPSTTFPHHPHHRCSLLTTHFGPAANAILFVFMHYPLMSDRWRKRPEEMQSAAWEEGVGFFCVFSL